MKKVEIPDHELSLKEAERFKKKARNYSIWYTSKFNVYSKKLKQKLLLKGYPKDGIIISKEKVKKRHPDTYQDMLKEFSLIPLIEEDDILVFDVINDTIEYLEKLLLLDDEEYVEKFILRKTRARKSISNIKAELHSMGFDKELINNCINNTPIDNTENIKYLINRYKKDTGYKKLTRDTDKYYYLLRKLQSKGFSYNDIIIILKEENIEE